MVCNDKTVVLYKHWKFESIYPAKVKDYFRNLIIKTALSKRLSARLNQYSEQRICNPGFVGSILGRWEISLQPISDIECNSCLSVTADIDNYWFFFQESRSGKIAMIWPTNCLDRRKTSINIQPFKHNSKLTNGYWINTKLILSIYNNTSIN